MRRILVLVLACSGTFAQTAAAPEPRQEGQNLTDYSIHIDVNLVQIDAVVTDFKGQSVTDLKSSDFEVLQDGKPQSITNFS
jgi:hypothetical protein